jgi:hypothetical protein
VGLGITQILKGIAYLVRARQMVTFYWVYLLWILLLFFFHIEIWWGMWGLRNIEQWSFAMYLARFSVPISLFFLSVLIFPDSEKTLSKTLDLRQYYFDNHRWFFLVFTTYPLSLILTESILGDQPIFHWANAVRLTMLSFLLLLAWPQRATHSRHSDQLYCGILIAICDA